MVQKEKDGKKSSMDDLLGDAQIDETPSVEVYDRPPKPPTMPEEKSKTIDSGAIGKDVPPTIVLVGCGGSGAKIVVNEVLGKDYTGPTILRTVNGNSEEDLDVRGAIVGKDKETIRGEINRGDATDKYVDFLPNFQGVDVKAYTFDWSGRLRLDSRAPHKTVRLSSTPVPTPKTISDLGDLLDKKLPAWACITYSDADESVTGAAQELHTGNSLAVGHAFMRGMRVRKSDLKEITYALPQFMKDKLFFDEDTGEININQAIEKRNIADLGDGWVYLPGKIDADIVNSSLTIPIRYRTEAVIDAEYSTLKNADLKLIAFLSSMSGGTGGAITEGLADLLYNMKYKGWPNAPKRETPVFLTWAGRTYPASHRGQDAQNAVVNLMSVLNKSRRIAKGGASDKFKPAINTDLIISTEAFYDAATAGFDGDIVATADETLVDIIMNFSAAVHKPLADTRGIKDAEIKEVAKYISGRAIAGQFIHGSKDLAYPRPKTKEEALKVFRDLAKPVSFCSVRKEFNGMFFKAFGPREFFEDRLTPSQYVERVVDMIESGATKEEITKKIPDSMVPVEYLTPTSILIAFNTPETGARKQQARYQTEAKYLVDWASILWRNAKALPYTGIGRKESTSILVGGESTITTEDLIYLYRNANVIYTSFNPKLFRNVFEHENKKELWNILADEEVPCVSKSKNQLEVIAAASNTLSGKGMYDGETVKRTLAHTWNCIYDRASIGSPDYALYDFGQPMPEPIESETVKQAQVRVIKEKKKSLKERFMNKAMEKYQKLRKYFRRGG